MALRDIVIDGDPQLRKKSREVTAFDSKLHKLLDDMYETMKKSDGIGLAAPQVGILRRVAIIHTEDDNIVEFINPVIITQDGEQVCNEGCLSVPNRRHNVLRPMNLTVKAYDRDGKEFEQCFRGLDANVCCHEFDHLDGILFYDKMIEDNNEDINDDEDISEE